MKKYSIVFIAVLALASCKNKDEFAPQQLDARNMVVAKGQLSMQDESMKKKIKPEDYPIIKFTETEFDFGTIKQGDKVEHIFKFTNEGKNDLYVMEVRPSCGCTAPEWTKTPVKKGKSGEIKIIFDSTGKQGSQTKTVTLLTNTEKGNDILTFKANILANESTTSPSENHQEEHKH